MATPSGRFAACESRVSPNVSSARCGGTNTPDKALTHLPLDKGASDRPDAVRRTKPHRDAPRELTHDRKSDSHKLRMELSAIATRSRPRVLSWGS